MIVEMRTYQKTRCSKRRNRQTRKGGDNKTHYKKLDISNQSQMNRLLKSYKEHLIIESIRMNDSSNPEDKEYHTEIQQLIDIMQNEKIPHERKQAIAVMAYHQGQKEKEESELQKLLNPMRIQQLKKLEEKLQQIQKNRENGKTNSTNFTKNNWSTFETMPRRVRR